MSTTLQLVAQDYGRISEELVKGKGFQETVTSEGLRSALQWGMAGQLLTSISVTAGQDSAASADTVGLSNSDHILPLLRHIQRERKTALYKTSVATTPAAPTKKGGSIRAQEQQRVEASLPPPDANQLGGFPQSIPLASVLESTIRPIALHHESSKLAIAHVRHKQQAALHQWRAAREAAEARRVAALTANITHLGKTTFTDMTRKAKPEAALFAVSGPQKSQEGDGDAEGDSSGMDGDDSMSQSPLDDGTATESQTAADATATEATGAFATAVQKNTRDSLIEANAKRVLARHDHRIENDTSIQLQSERLRAMLPPQMAELSAMIRNGAMATSVGSLLASVKLAGSNMGAKQASAPAFTAAQVTIEALTSAAAFNDYSAMSLSQRQQTIANAKMKSLVVSDENKDIVAALTKPEPVLTLTPAAIRALYAKPPVTFVAVGVAGPRLQNLTVAKDGQAGGKEPAAESDDDTRSEVFSNANIESSNNHGNGDISACPPPLASDDPLLLDALEEAASTVALLLKEGSQVIIGVYDKTRQEEGRCRSYYHTPQSSAGRLNTSSNTGNADASGDQYYSFFASIVAALRAAIDERLRQMVAIQPTSAQSGPLGNKLSSSISMKSSTFNGGISATSAHPYPFHAFEWRAASVTSLRHLRYPTVLDPSAHKIFTLVDAEAEEGDDATAHLLQLTNASLGSAVDVSAANNAAKGTAPHNTSAILSKTNVSTTLSLNDINVFGTANTKGTPAAGGGPLTAESLAEFLSLTFTERVAAGAGSGQVLDSPTVVNDHLTEASINGTAMLTSRSMNSTGLVSPRSPRAATYLSHRNNITQPAVVFCNLDSLLAEAVAEREGRLAGTGAEGVAAGPAAGLHPTKLPLSDGIDNNGGVPSRESPSHSLHHMTVDTSYESHLSTPRGILLAQQLNMARAVVSTTALGMLLSITDAVVVCGAPTHAPMPSRRQPNTSSKKVSSKKAGSCKLRDSDRSSSDDYVPYLISALCKSAHVKALSKIHHRNASMKAADGTMLSNPNEARTKAQAAVGPGSLASTLAATNATSLSILNASKGLNRPAGANLYEGLGYVALSNLQASTKEQQQLLRCLLLASEATKEATPVSDKTINDTIRGAAAGKAPLPKRSFLILGDSDEDLTLFSRSLSANKRDAASYYPCLLETLVAEVEEKAHEILSNVFDSSNSSAEDDESLINRDNQHTALTRYLLGAMLKTSYTHIFVAGKASPVLRTMNENRVIQEEFTVGKGTDSNNASRKQSSVAGKSVPPRYHPAQKQSQRFTSPNAASNIPQLPLPHNIPPSLAKACNLLLDVVGTSNVRSIDEEGEAGVVQDPTNTEVQPAGEANLRDDSSAMDLLSAFLGPIATTTVSNTFRATRSPVAASSTSPSSSPATGSANTAEAIRKALEPFPFDELKRKPVTSKEHSTDGGSLDEHTFTGILLQQQVGNDESEGATSAGLTIDECLCNWLATGSLPSPSASPSWPLMQGLKAPPKLTLLLPCDVIASKLTASGKVRSEVRPLMGPRGRPQSSNRKESAAHDALADSGSQHVEDRVAPMGKTIPSPSIEGVGGNRHLLATSEGDAYYAPATAAGSEEDPRAGTNNPITVQQRQSAVRGLADADALLQKKVEEEASENVKRPKSASFAPSVFAATDNKKSLANPRSASIHWARDSPAFSIYWYPDTIGDEVELSPNATASRRGTTASDSESEVPIVDHYQHRLMTPGRFRYSDLGPETVGALLRWTIPELEETEEGEENRGASAQPKVAVTAFGNMTSSFMHENTFDTAFPSHLGPVAVANPSSSADAVKSSPNANNTILQVSKDLSIVHQVTLQAIMDKLGAPSEVTQPAVKSPRGEAAGGIRTATIVDPYARRSTPIPYPLPVAVDLLDLYGPSLAAWSENLQVLAAVGGCGPSFRGQPLLMPRKSIFATRGSMTSYANAKAAEAVEAISTIMQQKQQHQQQQQQSLSTIVPTQATTGTGGVVTSVTQQGGGLLSVADEGLVESLATLMTLRRNATHYCLFAWQLSATTDTTTVAAFGGQWALCKRRMLLATHPKLNGGPITPPFSPQEALSSFADNIAVGIDSSEHWVRFLASAFLQAPAPPRARTASRRVSAAALSNGEGNVPRRTVDPQALAAALIPPMLVKGAALWAVK